MYILDRANIQKAEQIALKRGNTYENLMENAGAGVAGFIINHVSANIENLVILCGNGNNGGDGFVVARLLSDYCKRIKIILTNEFPKTDSAKNMYKKILNIGNVSIISYLDNDVKEAIINADIIVDAIFGIGFKGKIQKQYDDLLDAINLSKACRVSVDIPSGLQCDCGEILGRAVNANFTVTFTSLKPAHILYPSAKYCGNINVCNVGIEKDIIKELGYAKQITDEDIRFMMEKRDIDAHKGSIGTLLSLCGSYGMSGAAYLSSKAAFRCGAGLVKLALPKSIYSILATNLPEVVYIPVEENKNGSISGLSLDEILAHSTSADALLIGCGLTQGYDIRYVVEDIIKNLKIPMVIDADGINIISKNINILNSIKNSDIILTPHLGEMSRLIDVPVKDIQANRIKYAEEFALKYGAILVLKGANTVVAGPDGSVYFNLTGNPGMAVAGSGDVLAGMIASFLSQGIDALTSAKAGVYLHGLAGDEAAKNYTQRAMLSTDIIDMLPIVIKRYEDQHMG